MSNPNLSSVQQLIGTKQGRRLLSTMSPSFFCTYYLGYEYAAHQARWFDEADRLAREAKSQGTKKKCLILAPRDHGKSFLSVAMTVRAICLNRDVKILWISASAGQSEKRMRLCGSMLENERIVADWGSDDMPPFRTETSKWTNTQIYVVRPHESIDPTIEAVGSGGSITGGHVDLIICDDLVGDKDVFSAAVRQKTYDWIRATVQPMLNRGGLMLVVGTRKHADDIYAKMLKDSTFDVLHDRAIIKYPESYSFVMQTDSQGRDVIADVKVVGDSDVLWKEQRPIEYLLKEKHAVGSLLFEREFQNEVMSADTAPFKHEWLEAAKERGAEMCFGQIPQVQNLLVIQSWDLSLITDAKKAQAQDGDYTVGMTWGRDSAGNRYLIDMVRVRGISPNALYQLIQTQYHKYREHVSAIFIEKNAFGQLHILNLMANTDLPIKEHLTTAGNKNSAWTGVPALATLFENGKVVLPYKGDHTQRLIDTFCTEAYGLGVEAHDDTVMSLWIAECGIKSGAFSYSVSMDEGTSFDAFGNRTEIQLDDRAYESEVNKSHMSKLWTSLGLDSDTDDGYYH